MSSVPFFFFYKWVFKTILTFWLLHVSTVLFRGGFVYGVFVFFFFLTDEMRMPEMWVIRNYSISSNEVCDFFFFFNYFLLFQYSAFGFAGGFVWHYGFDWKSVLGLVRAASFASLFRFLRLGRARRASAKNNIVVYFRELYLISVRQWTHISCFLFFKNFFGKNHWWFGCVMYVLTLPSITNAFAVKI